jgi:hypothetical protein
MQYVVLNYKVGVCILHASISKPISVCLVLAVYDRESIVPVLLC